MLPPITGRHQLLPQKSFNAVFSRWSSSQPSASTTTKQVSPHIGFYKTFGRPIAKVFLMATFTYQLSYWLWVKLEKDEIISTRQAEISTLEAKLQDAVASAKHP